ncbi:hypothetical protein PSYAC_28483, partial [Pseudomonas syringae pv. actinidiae str. M302091]
KQLCSEIQNLHVVTLLVAEDESTGEHLYADVQFGPHSQAITGVF